MQWAQSLWKSCTELEQWKKTPEHVWVISLGGDCATLYWPYIYWLVFQLVVGRTISPASTMRCDILPWNSHDSHLKMNTWMFQEVIKWLIKQVITHLLLKMVLFQPAMLVYQRVFEWGYCLCHGDCQAISSWKSDRIGCGNSSAYFLSYGPTKWWAKNRNKVGLSTNHVGWVCVFLNQLTVGWWIVNGGE